MECIVYARERWGEITSKEYKSAGGNWDAQSLYNNWTGSKGKTMPDGNLPALALWNDNFRGAGHTGIVENKSWYDFLYSDHNGLDGGNFGYGEFYGTSQEIKNLFPNYIFIGFC
ncbi:MAG: hypothetical protein RR313_06315 [Anaerovoracaceae bacterium]